MTKKLFVVLAVLAVFVLAACGPTPTVVAPLPSPAPTETRRPDHTPLPIVEQTTDTPVVIPTGIWMYDSDFGSSGSLEYAYQRECKIKHPEWPCLYSAVYGEAIIIVHGDTTIIFANRTAFDFRSVIVGLPEFNSEDRWVWGLESDVRQFVADNNLVSNKNVMYVNTQTYAISGPGGAERELVAFGGGLTPQRWILSDGVFHQIDP